MKIELIKHPRYTDAPDNDCIWNLKVNGYVIGSYYGGKEKNYLDKEKWAKKMLKKRIPVLERNIKRLKSELFEFEKELQAFKCEKIEDNIDGEPSIVCDGCGTAMRYIGEIHAVFDPYQTWGSDVSPEVCGYGVEVKNTEEGK